MYAIWLIGCAVLAGVTVALLRGEVARTCATSDEPSRYARSGPPAGGLEGTAACLAAGFAWGLGPRVELIGFVALAAVGTALAAIDIGVHRLPTRLTAPLFGVLLAAFVAGAVMRGDATRLVSAVVGAAVLGVVYFLLAVIGRGQMGAGDLKLAPAVGLALGWFGPRALLLGSCAAFIAYGLVVAPLLVARRTGSKSELPFGPFMLAGVALMVAAAH